MKGECKNLMEMLVSAVFSGLLATVLTLVVTTVQSRKKEARDYKMRVFSDLIAWRVDILPGTIPTGNFSKAVNQVFIAYNDCPKVMDAFEAFRKNVIYRTNVEQDNAKIIDSLVMLLKAMADELNIDYTFSNDDLFTRPVFVGIPVVAGQPQNKIAK